MESKSWIPACAGMTSLKGKALDPGFRRNDERSVLADALRFRIRVMGHPWPARDDLMLKSFRLHQRDGHVEHAVRKTPLVVVPAQHLDERAAHDARLRRVVDAGQRVVVEVDRDKRLLVDAEDALELALARLLHRRVDLVLR